MIAVWPADLPSPRQKDYKLRMRPTFQRTEMDDGRTRQRARFRGVSTSLIISMLLTQEQEALFRSFWKYEVLEGANLVLVPLYSGTGHQLWTCRFPAGYKLQYESDHASLTLEGEAIADQALWATMNR